MEISLFLWYCIGGNLMKLGEFMKLDTYKFADVIILTDNTGKEIEGYKGNILSADIITHNQCGGGVLNIELDI